MVRLILLAMLLVLPATVFGNPQPRVVAFATDFVLPAKFELLQELAAEAGVAFAYRALEGGATAEFGDLLAGADLVLLDAPRGVDAMRLQQALGERLRAHGVPWLQVGSGGHSAHGLPAERAARLAGYYGHGGRSNFERLFAYLAGADDVAPPQPLPAVGIYHPRHPERVSADLDGYLHWAGHDGERPLLAGLIHENYLSNEQTAVLDALIARSEELGLLPLLFYYPAAEPAAIRELLLRDGEPLADVLFNMRHLQDAEALRAVFAELGVPVLQTLSWRDGDQAAWEADTSGVTMRTVPGFIAQPEYMGLTDPLVISAVTDGAPRPIDYQLEALLQKAERLARLRRLDNADKRVALFYYNYPSGEHNLAASNLNVPRSLEGVTAAMAAAGYQLQPLTEAAVIEQGGAMLAPFYRPEAGAGLIERDLAALLPLADYRRWLQTLPASVRAALEAHWGAPEAHPRVVDIGGEPAFVIPRLRNGNLLLLPQPPRGDGGNLHSTATPPDHAYLATYLYLREQFGADALIHFGTHGSQEWTPGKDRGLAAHDWPFLLLGDLPVIYPYIVDNIGEALQAKRRGRATVISHQTPPFAPAGLHGELYQLHDLIHDYELLDEGAVKARTRQAIIDTVTAGTLYKDLDWEPEAIEAHFDHFEHELHDYLHELGRSVQPLGLHSFGQAGSDEHLLSTVMQMLGEPYYALLDLEEPEELFVHEFGALQESPPYVLLRRHLLDGVPLEEVRSPALREQLGLGQDYLHRLRHSPELDSLLAALAGRYIATSYGGDPIRNPDSLPTGRNLYGFDPARLPAEQAYAAGAEALADLLAAHQAGHGQYPQKLAFSLWSSEAMRHLGVVESQLLHALGLEPVWDQGGRLTELQIIPRERLGRPRIDAVVQVTGVYRDQFDGFMRLLAAAMAELANLPEADNPLYINSRSTAEALKRAGLTAEEAAKLSRLRIFGNPPGRYGTGLPEQVLATDAWDDEAELAQSYLERMQYAYGADDAWGLRVDQLNLYAEQLKGVDAAVLARSSNLHGVLSTDHPFEFLGGLGLAVRHVSGSSPSLYIADLRDPASGRMQSLSRFLATELRSRQLHPQWLSNMQAEGYAGTLSLLNTVNNFWGWQVMDPGVVRPDQWQALHETYVMDALELGLDEWFEQHNPHALGQIVERMLEAVRMEYWEATEQTVRELVERYRQLQEQHGVASLNDRFNEHLETLAGGFGLGPDAVAEGSAQPLSGPLLEPVTHEAAAPAGREHLLLFLLLVVVLAGAAFELRRQRRLVALH